MKYSISDEIYNAAYKFRQNEIWQYIDEKTIVSVKLQNRSPMFINVVGFYHSSCGIIIYPDVDDYKYFRRAAMSIDNVPEYLYKEYSEIPNDIEMFFFDIEEVPDKILADVYDYNQRYNPITGEHNNIPSFIYKKSRRDNVPLDPDSEPGKYMLEALNALNDLYEMFEIGYFDNLDLIEHFEETGEIILLEKIESKYQHVDTFPLPDFDESEMIYLKTEAYENDVIRLKELKGKAKGGVLEADIYMLPKLTKTVDYPYPFYPYVFGTYDQKEKLITPYIQSNPYDTSGLLLEEVVDGWVERNYLPNKIIIQNKRTFYFLEDLASQVGIELEIVDRLENADKIIVSPKNYDKISDPNIRLMAYIVDINEDDNNYAYKTVEMLNYFGDLEPDELALVDKELVDAIGDFCDNVNLPRTMKILIKSQINTYYNQLNDSDYDLD